MKNILRAFFIFGFAVILIGLFLNWPTNQNKKGTEIFIKNGDSSFTVANKLKQHHLIRSKYFFVGLAKLTGQSHKLKKGLYFFSGSDSTLKIFWDIVHGKIYTIKVTIPEGYSIWLIDEILTKKNLIKKNDFIKYATHNTLYKQIGFLPQKNLEGFLFPNTYAFPKQISVKNIALIMVQEFSNQIIRRYKQELKTKNLYKILKMASLVEKEARLKEEQPLIAQVFWRRLSKGIKLMCDPTVAYAVKKFKGERLRYRDLRFDSPYNTYKYKGLPPTPICNPGVDAFEAVLHPAKTQYLYFVAKNDGTHYFSKTLKEHNKAVAQYQLHKE